MSSTSPLPPVLRWLFVLLGPVLLLLVTYLAGGARFDTNDDFTLELLLQGVAAAHPLHDLHLYLLGWTQLTAALYAWQPLVPWYDALQVLWLYGALAAIFYVLAAALPAGRRGWYPLAVGAGLFAASYALHLLQVNFTRPALLLGGAAGALLTLHAPARQTLIARWVLAGLLFGAGWGIRPEAAELGLLLLLPVGLLRPARHWGTALLLVLALAGGLTLAARLGTTPAAARYGYLNGIRTGAFDYQLYTFNLRTATDSLAHATLRLGSGPYDAKLVNADFLRRCLQAAPPLAPAAVLREWQATTVLLLRQWQKLALVLLLAQWAVVGAAVWRGQLSWRDRRLWLFAAYQGFFWVLYLGIGIHFHPVARVAQPMITLYLLGNFLLLAGLGRLTLAQVPLPAGWAALAGVALLLTARQDYGLARQSRLLEQAHATYLARLTQRTSGTVLVEGGLYNELDNLALFKSYGLLRYRRIVPLAGWSTFDPSRPDLYYSLTGQRDVAAALLQLGHRPDVTWALEPKFAVLLQKYLNARSPSAPGHAIVLVPAAGAPLPGGPQLYTFHEAGFVPPTR